mmetsp:Transcript_94351/g.148454  ORF Transcript_94351/g.148454 Transcript_94351/m.148454 type:complete len:206 (+) Transcript_94351:73-690(+)
MSVNLSSVNLGGPPANDSSAMNQEAVGGGSARAIALAKGVAAAMPGVVQAIPGDPVIAQRVGVVGSALLAVTSVLGLVGVLKQERSAIALLADIYGSLLAALCIVLEADHPQLAVAKDIISNQARVLGSPQGLAVLLFVQTSLAFALGTVWFVLSGIVALSAGILHVVIWYTRSSAIGNDNTPLVASHEIAAEEGNMDIMLQQVR